MLKYFRLRHCLRTFAAVVGAGLAAAHAQTFSGGQVASGASSSNLYSALAHTSSGDIYGFWKIQVSSTGVYYVIKWNGTGWTQLKSFTPANMVTGSVGTQDELALAVDSAGHLHVTARNYGAGADATAAPRTIAYGYSEDGTSWAFTTVFSTAASNSGHNTREPSIAVDANNHPHILFRANEGNPHSLRYYTFNGTSWSGSSIYSSANTTNEINSLAFALDSAGHAHVVFVGEITTGTDGSPFYMTNASGSWSTPVKLQTGSSATTTPRVAVVVDKNDKVHILYQNGDSNRGIYYYSNVSGSFSGAQVNGNLTGGIMRHSFAVNASGHLFFSYNPGASDSGTAGYAYRLSGQSTWTTGSVFTNASDTANTMTLSFPVDLSDTGVATMLYNTSTNPRLLKWAQATIAASNTTPSFVGATTTLGVAQNAGATSVKALLHVSDSDSGQTLTWSQSSAPSHGTLSISGATVASGGTDLTPGGTITYTPTAGYAGSDSFTVQVSDGTATATRTITVTVTDITKPTVVSMARANSAAQPLTTATTAVTFRVTYSEAVTGVAAANFQIENVNGGTITGTVGTPSAVSTSVYDIPVTLTGGSGEFRLKVVN